MTILATALLIMAAALPPLNCATPQTPLQAAICADPSLRAADNSLTAEFNALLQRTTKASHEALAQLRAELEDARALCLVNPKILTECLRDVTDRQRWTLSGAPFSGPGAGSPASALFMGREATLQTPRYRVLLPVFTAPRQSGARIVNQALARYFRDAPDHRRSWRWSGDRLVYSATGEVAFASPAFVSLRLNVSRPDEDGVIRYRTLGLNQRLDADTQSRFASLFVEGANTRLAPVCKTKIDELARDVFAGIPLASRPVIDRAALAEAIGDLQSWVFDASGAQIVFEQGANRFFCNLGIEEIRPLLADGVKIWP